MKKLLLLFLATVLLLQCFGMVACNSETEEDGQPNGEIQVISKSTFRETSDKYRVVDSFVLDDDRYYYFFHIGTIDYVPLNTYSAEGVYFNGNDMTLEFKMTTANKDESIREIKNSISSSVNLKTETYVKGSVSANMMDVFEAKMESGITSHATNTISNTSSDSYSMSISNESLYEKTITYNMDKDDPVGFYFYTPVASVKVYEAVVYNPNTNQIEYMTTYNQFGSSFPGLFYSEYSFMDFGDYPITFEEKKLPNLEKPTAHATSDITIPIDANGGSCAVNEWSGKIGQVYGTLPIAERHGYKFVGWYADGIKIDENSYAIAANPIVARWELLTSVTYNTTGSVSVNANHKLNPFGLIVFGTSGEEGASFDKILNDFDLAALKDAGYSMRVILEYDVKNAWNLGVGLNYNIAVKSNNSNIAVFSENVNSTSYVHKKNYSRLINLDSVTGSLAMEVSTKNVVNVTIENMVITVEFIKN